MGPLSGMRLAKALSTACLCFFVVGCEIITLPYHVTKGVVRTAVYVVKGGYELTAGTTKIVYRIGKFTYKVVKAPLDWPLRNTSIETIDGVPPHEAIREGRVKTAPYRVKGKTYYPMSVEEAQTYEETGIASWYGYETSRQKGGAMTANGEAFDPQGLTAAHKYRPRPTHVKVTNLENGRSVILRVNDRGPFPSDRNPASEKRIIDVSERASKVLGFHNKGVVKVKVETIQLEKG
jgi:rare lipoprotein A